jgi:hypothetical protein
VGLSERAVRRENFGSEKDVKGGKMQVSSARWCWQRERGGGSRKQVDYVGTLASAGEGTVRYSTRFHLSHVEITAVSEADTHGFTRGVNAERDFLIYVMLEQCGSSCNNTVCDFIVLSLECYRDKVEKVDLFALCTSRNVQLVAEVTREVCGGNERFRYYGGTEKY